MKPFSKYQIPKTEKEKKENRKQLLLGVLSGVMLGCSYPPIPLPFLALFAFIPFYYVIEKRETLLEINRFVYFSLFFFCLITLYWVGSWTKETDPFLMISGGLLLFANPGFYLIATTLYYFSRKIFSKKIALFLFPFYWVTFEYMYSLTDLRFPWLTLGNSQPYFNQFIQIADIIGVYGISLLILYINIFLYLSIKSLRQEKKLNNRFVFAALLLFIIPMTYGAIKMTQVSESKKSIKVGLVQPNLNPWEKWLGGNLNDQLNIYLRLSEKAINNKARLIIWPESALPVYFLSGNYSFEVDRLRYFVNVNKIDLITGMPDATFYFDLKLAPKDAKKLKRGDVAYTSYNSILLFSKDNAAIQKYGKIKLVPFGEKVPFVEELPFLGDWIKWQVGISSWNVGKEQTVFDIHPIKVGGVICIESIYPEFVAEFVKKGAQLLAVVTNDSWYGYSSGPFQHKEIAVLRAIENRRTVVRAANGGISCIIDPYGRTLAKTELFTRDVLTGYAPIHDEITFYTRYPYIIPWLSCFISAFTIIWFSAFNIIKRKKSIS
jgi:apolipoprotein N-acyltransferase